MKNRNVSRALSFACFAIFFCSTSSCISSCKRKGNSQANSNAQEAEFATTPPFATKEPPRYRAVRTIISKTGDVQAIAKTRIFRDGQKRREEYVYANGATQVSLWTPSGYFVLLPFANVVADGDTQPAEPYSLITGSEMSPDGLLNEMPVNTRYQSLGAETLNGRAATKYRCITTPQTKGTSPTSETLIWIDDTLGMPIRWESRSTVNGIQNETTMELSEMSLDVAPTAFELPKDYRKVSGDEFSRLILDYKQKEAPKTVKN